ncbi:ash family protein [Salmonella enterica subsp. diarizonae serovar 48:i:z]|nr:hypothetical protein [Salmonella enterica subsp. diarizonae serovar 48:i:z]EDN5748688.1 ash family protein [Salmonella enterica subsp. diarizonae serovar 48:i:z]
MKEYYAGQITRLCAGGQFIGTLDIIGKTITQEAHKTKATPKDRQWHRTKPVQDNRKSAISATCAGEEKALILTICNQYVGYTAWRTSIAVYDHFSAISRMRHAARNGAVFFDGVGLAPTHTSTDETSRRPSMVLLVGERSRSLANLLAGLPIPASDATSTTAKKCLRTYNGLGYVFPASHETGAGCRNPNMYKAIPDAPSVFFVVCYTCHSMAWCTLFNVDSAAAITHNGVYHVTHNGAMCTSFDGVRSQSLSLLHRTPRRPIMVTLAGQPQGWPVSLYAGIPTPVNVTASIECRNSSGDSLNLYKEAVYHG